MRSPDYARIINERHFNRLLELLKSGRILFGGRYARKDLYISPTIIDRVSPEEPLMQEKFSDRCFP
jgi:aldehyde dehydrogenase (NAD+)